MADWPEGAARSRTVLIVDDFAPFRRVLARLLEGEGWTVLEAASAREAIRAASRRMPDLAVVDWCLGGQADGLALMRELRRLCPLPQVPVVVVSAVRDEADDEATAVGAGAALFFSKLEVAAAGAAFARHVDALCRSAADTLPLDGGFRLELSSGLLLGGARHARLNPQECRLLELLARARGRLVTHEQLWDQVWAAPRDDWRHLLSNRISTLRRKAGPLGKRLLCRRGEGFLLSAAP